MQKRTRIFKVGYFTIGEDNDALHKYVDSSSPLPTPNGRWGKENHPRDGGWLINRNSLRQYDLDQVMRVERGSLLSVPHRGAPRSVI
jgi:hypothetical protein